MATTADAEVVLKLYELRREELMRKARIWIFSFEPDSVEEILVVQRDSGSDQNAYWRQVTTYWEMAAAIVLRGAVDPDLYFDVSGEGLAIFAKFRTFHEDYEKATGRLFMPNTAKLITTFPAAKRVYDRVCSMQDANRARTAQQAETKPALGWDAPPRD